MVVASDRPAVQISWHDADAYAGWLSRKTGETYRLPTDEEWPFAAGSKFKDDGVPVDDDDPSKRWIARYERESDRGPTEARTHNFGAFGINENGLLDMGGNVREWTSTCFVRTVLTDAGAALSKNLTAAFASSKASIALMSPTSSATHALAVVRSAFLPTTLVSG